MEYDLINLVSNVGFPIAMTIWLLWRTDKVIDANTQALKDLAEIVQHKLK